MGKDSPSILRLTLHREFFGKIAAGTKRVEYREQKPYWKARLENKSYEAILFRNGYVPNAPEMLVAFHGLRRYGSGRDSYYAILLGRVLSIKRWKP